MVTNGFDLVSETNISFVNKLLFSAYHIEKFPHQKTGAYLFPFSNVPESWKEFTRLAYEIHFGVPVCKSAEAGMLELEIPALATFTALEEIKFDMGIRFLIQGPANLSATTRQIILDFNRANVTTEILNTFLPPKVAGKLRGILSEIMLDYLRRDVKSVAISPVLYRPALPYSTQPLLISSEDTGFIPNSATEGIHVLQHTGGNLGGLEDFTGGKSLAAAVSDSAMHSIFDFWWSNKKVPASKTTTKTDVIDYRLWDQLWDRIITIISVILLFPPEWLLAWIISHLIDFDERIKETKITAEHSKPSITLLEDNKVKISGSVTVKSVVKTFIKFTEYWSNLGKPTQHKKEIFSLASPDVAFDYEATATAYLDPDYCLELRINEWNFYLPGPMNWLGDFKKNLEIPLLKDISDAIIKAMPPLILSPPLLSSEFPGTDLGIYLRAREVSSTPEEILLKTDLSIDGLSKYEDAPLVANNNRASMEVHKADCVWAKKIALEHRVPYFFLDEAHAEGYDNCYYCLGNSKR